MTKKSKKLGVKTNKTTVFDEPEEVSSAEIDNKKETSSSTKEISSEDSQELSQICSTLDKLYLDLLILMRKTMQEKLKIEKSMTDGELHLSKSRYIMGHKNVSKLQLPTENSTEIDPSLTLEEIDDEKMFGKPHLKLLTEEYIKNKPEDETEKNIQDPIKWFGVLVPRNLKLAQNNYRGAVSWAVDCANTQIKLHQTCVKIKQLTQLKKEMLKTKNEE